VPPRFEPNTIMVEPDDPGAQKLMLTVAPFHNDASCRGCHDKKRRFIGVAILEASTTELDAQLDRLFWETLVGGLVLLLVAIGAVYLVQRSLVIRPIERLTTLAKTVPREGGAEDGAAADEVTDEVRQLAKAFGRMVERLVQAREQLEEKVRDRTSALQSVSEQLQTLHTKLMQVERMATMGELAANLAHEVRTPLNALSINLQLLKRERKAVQRKDVEHAAAETADNATDTARDTVVILEAELSRINSVIEQFLRCARVPRPQLASIDLNEICNSVVSLLTLEARRCGVDLVTRLHPSAILVQADADQLHQVLVNLVLNAIQAMPDGGQVEIRSRCVGDDARAEVCDDGPGIASEIAETMFKPFVTSKDKGTGLGLAIASRIVRAHGGTLSAENNPSGGATFQVAIPLAAPEPT